MEVRVQRGEETWTVIRAAGGPMPIDYATDRQGLGFPLVVDRSLHAFGIPCEWRREGRVEGIHPVEAIALRFDVVISLEILSRALRVAEEIGREMSRLGWTEPGDMQLVGEALVCGKDRFVAREALSAMRALAPADPTAEPLTDLLDHPYGHVLNLGLRVVPTFLQSVEPAGVVYAVRRDGVALALDETGFVRVLDALPDVPIVPSHPNAPSIPGHLFCPACDQPHPDRKTCP